MKLKKITNKIQKKDIQDKLISKIIDLVAQKNYSKILELTANLNHKTENYNSQLDYLLALTYKEIYQYDLALQHVNRAILGEIDNPNNYILKANILNLVRKNYLLNNSVFNITKDTINQINIYLEESLFCYFKALKFNKKDPKIIISIAKIYIRMNKFDQAIKYLNLSLNLDPNNNTTKYLLDVVLGRIPEFIPKDTVMNIYDSLAKDYDYLYIRNEQEVTKIIINECKKITDVYFRENKVLKIIDLGCGTGNLGREIIQKISNARISGLDISKKMIIEAKKKGNYYQLIELDLFEYLKNYHDKFDFILAVKLLEHFGNLSEFFLMIRNIMNDNSVFIFTIETMQSNSYSKDYGLNINMKYVHSEDYISCLCKKNQLKILFKKNLILRQDYAGKVNGLLFVVQKEKESSPSIIKDIIPKIRLNYSFE